MPAGVYEAWGGTYLRKRRSLSCPSMGCRSSDCPQLVAR